jgi:class 3 adenylate cyclase/tetratricopeptide (TPR) repeat protein
MQSISEWLHSVGLDQYTQIFADNDIDLGLISSLSEQDLEKLGVSSLGHRKRLLKVIAELREGARRTPSFAPSPHHYTPPHLAERILTSRSAMEGERKLVSVLFCDIAQSTELATRIGADAMHTLLNRFFELALVEVHRVEGTINQFLGDGFMALFGAPLAHEDHVRRALLSALAIQHRLHGVAGEEPTLREIRVRMGVNTGTVVVGKIGDNLRMDYTAVGDTTNLAARLQQSAHPDTIRVSAATQRAAAAWFEFKPLGEQTLKGIAEPLDLFELVKARAAGGAGISVHSDGINSPLVGRDAELAGLSASLKALHDGRGGIVFLTGDPGVGKSRLLAEIRRSSDAQGICLLEGRSLSFGRNLSYWPFIEVLKQVFDIQEKDTEAQAWSKLERRCAQLFDGHAEEIVPYLATVLALEMSTKHEQRVKYLDSQALGGQVFLSMRQLFERLSARGPILVLMEDWHWVDQSSTALCEHLLPLATGNAISFWFAARHEPKQPMEQMYAAVGAIDKCPPARQIDLTPLAETHSSLLLRNLLGGDNLPETLLSQILHKAEGNPFFIEEIVRALIADDTLVRDSRTHAWRMTKPLEAVALPDTVQGVIVARIDRLEEEVKDALKLASVIGRSFFFRILQVISDAGRALDSNLQHLQQAELVRVRQQLPELEYVFKHALMQEAAYGSIVSERRKMIHRSVAQAIERIFADRVEEFLSVLAYHYARAEEWGKAQSYLLKAGDQAGRMAADAEALDHYQQAMAMNERALGDRWPPTQKARLHRVMGEALFRMGQLQKALTFLEDALTHLGRPYPKSQRLVRMMLAKEMAMRLWAALVLKGMPYRKGRKGNPDVAQEVGRVLLAMGWIHMFQDGERVALDTLLLARTAEESGDSEQMSISIGYVGWLFNLLGMHRVAAPYHRRAIALAAGRSPLAIGHTRFAAGHGGYYAGNWASAGEHFEIAAQAFRDIGHFHLWGGPACWRVFILHTKGSADSVRLSEEIVQIGLNSGDVELQGWSLLTLGVSLRHAGEYDRAIAAFKEATPIFQSISDPHDTTLVLAETALCLARKGEFREALEFADRATGLGRESNPKGYWKVHSEGAVAETYVLITDQAYMDGKAPRGQLAEKALRLVRDAVKQGRTIHSMWAPDSLRLLGACQWRAGEHTRARTTWAAAATMARNLGARQVLAQIHMEMGIRTNNYEEIDAAASLFTEAGLLMRTTEAHRQFSLVCRAGS